jgi:molybdopterin-guanine dinucleotide biosynthesis protein A
LVAWVIDAVAKMGIPKPAPSAEELSGDGVDTVATSTAAGAAPANSMALGRPDALIVANRNFDGYSLHARIICDDATGFRGPLAGVAAALRVCATRWLLTLPVDCPEPPSDLIDRLFGGALGSDANCVAVHDGEQRQPLFALYRRELAQSAAAAVAAGQGVWQWQASIGARELDFSDRRRQFQNLNTPEDFAAYAKHRLAR